jgi:hypothetical protein
VKQSGSGSSLVSTLKITDGTHTASIKFDGSYSAASFMATGFGSSGTQLSYTGH